MLIVQPRLVKLGGSVMPSVASISIDRTAEKVIKEWNDVGPQVVFVDAVRQTVAITIVQRLEPAIDDDATGRVMRGPTLGEPSMLEVETAIGRGDGGAGRIEAMCVAVSVRHDLAGKAGPTRTIEFVCVSTTGDADPVTATAV